MFGKMITKPDNNVLYIPYIFPNPISLMITIVNSKMYFPISYQKRVSKWPSKGVCGGLDVSFDI
jgi:hypothetical protein